MTVWKNGKLTWCSGNFPKGPQTIQVPVPVEGNLENSFAIVSRKIGGKISLQALPLDNINYTVPLFCIVDQNMFEMCRNRTKRGLKKISYCNETGEFNVDIGVDSGGSEITEDDLEIETYDEY